MEVGNGDVLNAGKGEKIAEKIRSIGIGSGDTEKKLHFLN